MLVSLRGLSRHLVMVEIFCLIGALPVFDSKRRKIGSDPAEKGSGKL
jgi:hypothetical protein